MYCTPRSLSFRALLCAFVALCFFTPSSRGEFVITFSQVGDNVAANGTGTLDTTDLTLRGFIPSVPFEDPSDGIVVVGRSPSLLLVYTGIAGPSEFGTGAFTLADSGSGAPVGVDAALSAVLVPWDYKSGSTLSDSMAFENTTISDLGLTPGTYKWTWGSGADADSLTEIVPAANLDPEPSSLILAGTALGFAGLCMAIRRLRAAAVAA